MAGFNLPSHASGVNNNHLQCLDSLERNKSTFVLNGLVHKPNWWHFLPKELAIRDASLQEISWFQEIFLYKSIGKSAFSGNLQAFQDFFDNSDWHLCCMYNATRSKFSFKGFLICLLAFSGVVVMASHPVCTLPTETRWRGENPSASAGGEDYRWVNKRIVWYRPCLTKCYAQYFLMDLSKR